MATRTLATAKAELRDYGMTLRKTADGEYRVSFRNGGEASAYYTTCIADAVETGKLMSAKGGK